MLAISPQELLQAVISVDLIQRKLLKAFFVQNPAGMDFSLLGGFPKTGKLNLDQETWEYRRHGVGYCFTNDDGCVIDVHNYFHRASCIVDAHRMTEYLIASREELGRVKNLYSIVEDGLKKLEKAGVLIRARNAPLAWEVAAARD